MPPRRASCRAQDADERGAARPAVVGVDLQALPARAHARARERAERDVAAVAGQRDVVGAVARDVGRAAAAHVEHARARRPARARRHRVGSDALPRDDVAVARQRRVVRRFDAPAPGAAPDDAQGSRAEVAERDDDVAVALGVRPVARRDLERHPPAVGGQARAVARARAVLERCARSVARVDLRARPQIAALEHDLAEAHRQRRRGLLGVEEDGRAVARQRRARKRRPERVHELAVVRARRPVVVVLAEPARHLAQLALQHDLCLPRRRIAVLDALARRGSQRALQTTLHLRARAAVRAADPQRAEVELPEPLERRGVAYAEELARRLGPGLLVQRVEDQVLRRWPWTSTRSVRARSARSCAAETCFARGATSASASLPADR